MSGAVGIIGGSITPLLELGSAETIDASTRWGAPSAPVRRQTLHGHTVYVLARHGEDGNLPPHQVNYRANLAALVDLGCRRIIALNAVGGISTDSVPGSLAVPHQIIDYTWGRPHTFFDGSQTLEFVDFTEPYDSHLRDELISAGQAAGVDLLTQGVYGATQGPRLETAAEIDRMERAGCTLVGMTGMPEAALARELGLAYASLCQVVNRAAGRSDGAIHAEIAASLKRTAESSRTLLEHWLRAL